MSDLEIIKPKEVQNIIDKFCMTIGMLPTSYKLSLTYEEQIIAIGRYLEETVYPAINNNAEALTELQGLFIDLKDYVENYFDNLDIQTEVNNKIDAMVLDGTLAEIINQEIFDELNSEVEELQDKVDIMEKYPSTNIGLHRIFRFLEDSEYLSMQGGCITPNNSLICAMWDGTTNVKIYEISLVTGLILKQASFTFGWCNSITFDNVNNLVYVAHRGQTIDDVSTNLKKVSILRYSDLSLISTIDFSDYVQGVYFDKETSKLYFMNEWESRSSFGFKIYEVNQTNFAIENTITIDYQDSDIDKLRIQNFAITENKILLIASEPQAIIVYNMDGELVREYNLPEYVNNIYYTGEYQFIDYTDGTYYIGSDDVVEGIESINQIFKFKFDDEYINGERSEVGVHAGGSYTVNVDVTSTSLNPDGSASNKFKSINEAIRYKTASRGLNVSVAAGTYHGVYLRSRNNVHITGAGETTIIKGLNIGYCNEISINNATIEDCEFTQNGVINILKSNVYVKSLNVNDLSTRFGINISDFSTCNISSSVVFDVLNANEIYIKNDSLLINNAYTYKIQKHQKNSKIIGEGLVKLFQNPSNMCIGSFEIDSSWAYTDYEFYRFFDYMIVQYKVGSDHYAERIPLVSATNRFTLSRCGTANNSVTFVTCVTVDFNDTNKLRLRYSKITTRDATGAGTTDTNADNDNPETNSIIIENVYFE